jgi:hypothetical protein
LVTPRATPALQPDRGEIGIYQNDADSSDAAIRYDGAQSRADAIQIQSQTAKKAFDIYIAEMSKLSEMCANMIRNTQTR